jgi:hypothetical protein
VNGDISKSDLAALLTYKSVGGTILVTFDAENRQIVPVNAFENLPAAASCANPEGNDQD